MRKRLRASMARVERTVERMAEAIGTLTFLSLATFIIIIWITINGGYAYFSHALVDIATGKPFDPAPWILLNLIFSSEAFFSASFIIIAQKAQSRRAHVQQELNAVHREELAQETHEHILRLEYALLEHLQRVEVILAARGLQESPRGDGGENPSSPPSGS